RRLTQTAATVQRTTRRAGAYQLAFQWLLVFAALFLLDLLFGLAAWLRWIALIGQAVFAVIGVRRVIRRRTSGAEEWAARVVEQRHPELDNALINAVQFQRALGG